MDAKEQDRERLRRELIETLCTPEAQALARKIAEANEPFRRQLENCCHWYFGPPLPR